MEVAEQEQEWPKEVDEMTEKEPAALQGRRSRNRPAAAASSATGVRDDAAGSSGDEMLPFSDPVSESSSEEEQQQQQQVLLKYPQKEQLPYNFTKGSNKGDNNEAELRKTETDGSNGRDIMLTSSGPVDEFQEEEEEELQIGIGQFESEPQPKLEKNVFYDQHQGMWKCRNCCWTYQSGCPWIDHTQHSKWQLHMRMNPESVNRWQRCFFCETEGTETISGYSVADNSGVQGSAPEEFFPDDGLVATITKVDSQRDDSYTGFGLQPSEKSSEEQKTKKSLADVTESHDEIQLVEEFDNEVAEFDVERVLEKQQTHDLYCPNCNSCITRRVILRKRKRNIRIAVDDPKRYKLETVVASKLNGTSVHATNAADLFLDGRTEPAADDYDHVREPEIFRCLSCFSFFIPSGEGFTLFNIFGDKSVKVNMQSPQPIPAVKKNWLSSIFAFRKEETLSEQGSGYKTYVEENVVVESKQEVASPPLSVGAQGLGQNSTAKHQNGGVSIVPSSTQLAGRTPVQTEEPAKNVISKPQQGGLNFLVHSSTESATLEESGKDEKLNSAIEWNIAGPDVGDSKLQKPVPVLAEPHITEKVNILADFPSEKGKNVGAKLSISSVVQARNMAVKITRNGKAYPSEASQHDINGTKVDIHREETLNSDKGAFSIPEQDALLPQDARANITKDPAKSIARGTDTLITIEGPVDPTGSQEAQDITTLPETVPLIRRENAEARGSRGVEIIKSMVYGGLIESITSLGIVSSAAGADASTLNILALGLANLVGGLFVIGHNLWDLKNDHPVETSDQVNTQKNRYQDLLGRRQNFLLHATVAILSYIIFGLIPPVVYGFSFRVSDNVDYKLIAVAGASLLCIIILAIGKVYVQRPPKAYVKTIIYYVVMGFMASGVSYAVGDLIKILMNKLGWFDSTQALTHPIPGTTPPVKPAWGSY